MRVGKRRIGESEAALARVSYGVLEQPRVHAELVVRRDEELRRQEEEIEELLRVREAAVVVRGERDVCVHSGGDRPDPLPFAITKACIETSLRVGRRDLC